MKKLRALFIGAHPDDCEISGGGLAIKLVREGHRVKFCSLTDGRFGAYRNWGDALVSVRREDMEKVGAFIGCETEMLDNHDGSLLPALETREKLIRLIRRFDPDLIFTHRTVDYHPDHRYTGVLTTDAAFMLKIPGICPDVPPMRRLPCILFFQDHFTKPYPLEPSIVIDISNVWEDKFRAIIKNEDQLFDWLPWVEGIDEPDKMSMEEKLRWARNFLEPRDTASAEKYRTVLAREYGQRGESTTHAEAYEAGEHGAELSAELKDLLLSL